MGNRKADPLHSLLTEWASWLDPQTGRLSDPSGWRGESTITGAGMPRSPTFGPRLPGYDKVPRAVRHIDAIVRTLEADPDTATPMQALRAFYDRRTCRYGADVAHGVKLVRAALLLMATGVQ